MKQSPQWLHQEVYCQRGDLENRIKELRYGMEIGRTSCTNFWANQFRVLMTAAAYVLMQELRSGLVGTPTARAQVSILRDGLSQQPRVCARIGRGHGTILFWRRSQPSFPKLTANNGQGRCAGLRLDIVIEPQ